jgi:signal transduction histidine kinase
MTMVAAIKMLTFLESVGLALLANRQDPTSATNAAFVRYVLFVAASCLVEFMLVTATSVPTFLFWKHFDVFMFFAVAAIFHFSLMLRGHPWATSRRFRGVLYGTATAIALCEGFLTLPRLAVRGTWSFEAVYPPVVLNLHSGFVVLASSVAIAAVVVFRGSYRHARDRRSRVQAGIFWTSSLVLVAIGASVELTSAFIPSLELPLSVTATTAYLLVNPFIAFAVVRYGLLQLSPVSAVSAIMDLMSESVLLSDLAGALHYANKAARALLGQAKVGSAGLPLGGLMLRDGGAGAVLGYEGLRNDGKGLRDRECILESDGRGPLPVAVSSTVLDTALWGETGIIITLRDVSERRKMEELRDSADRIMRHDLRNTLTGIFALSSTLVADRALVGAPHENAALIHDGARLLNEQIDAYLYLRSVEDGAFKTPLEDVDLAEVLRSVLRNQGPPAESLNVHLVLLLDGRPVDTAAVVKVRGIHSMLFGIFQNFVKNAIEASPFGSEVRVAIRTAPAVVVSVHNRGAIPVEVRPRFFTKFATAGKRRGAGLGAYGARLMAEALGCRVSFSTSDDAGTEIVVRFGDAQTAAHWDL